MKSRTRKSTKQKILDAKPDPYAFKNLKTKTNMKIKQEHRSMLGKFIIEQGYKIAKGKDDKTFEEIFETLREIVIQTKKLRDTYE